MHAGVLRQAVGNCEGIYLRVFLSVGKRTLSQTRLAAYKPKDEPFKRPVRLSDLRKKDSAAAAPETGSRPSPRTDCERSASDRSPAQPPEELNKVAFGGKTDRHLRRGQSYERPDTNLEQGDEPAKKNKYQKRDKSDPDKEFERAKLSALGSLGLKMHTRQQLREKLRSKEYAEDVTERTLDRMEELGTLSDTSYAEVFARLKWKQSKWAPSRISLELQKKGVSKDVCRSVLEETFGSHNNFGIHMRDEREVDPSEGQDTHWDSLEYDSGLDEQLVQTVRRRHDNMLGNLTKETKRRRLIAWMQRRGHSWDVVSEVMKRTGL